MSAADVRIRADEIRHERTDARKTRWTASLHFVTVSGLTFVNKLHSVKSLIVIQSRHVYNRERKLFTLIPFFTNNLIVLRAISSSISAFAIPKMP